MPSDRHLKLTCHLMKYPEACDVCPVFFPLLFSLRLNLQEDDITKMLAATTHIGSDNSEKTMEQYIFKKKNDGINIINLKKTWEKILLAARAIAAVENPQVTISQFQSFNLTIFQFHVFQSYNLTISCLSILLSHNFMSFSLSISQFLVLQSYLQDVFVCASRPYTQRAVLKFAR